MSALKPRAPDAFRDDSISVEDVVRFADRHWLLVIGCALLAAVLTLLVAGLVLPPTYVSSAALVVVPPRVSSELQPRELTVFSYKAFLESPAVVLEARRRLIEDGVLDDDDSLELGDDLEVRIFISRRQDTTALAPILEAVGRSDDAGTAASLANTWVAVFLEEVRELVRRTTREGIDFVEEQHPKAGEVLEKREAEWAEASADYQARIQEVSTRGDRRIAAFKKQTSVVQAEHRSESRRLIEELVQTRVAELSATDGTAAEGIVRRLSQLASVRTQMAQTASLLVLEKAITDDALWQALAIDRLPDLDLSGGLLTQEANPIYHELALRSIRLEEELKRLAGVRLETVAATIADLEKLQLERSVGLEALEKERSLELTVLQRRRQREVDEISRERDIRLAQIQRSIDRMASLERELSRDYNEAILAKAQEDIDAVYLAAAAVPAPDEEDRGLALKGVLGLVAGGVLGVVIALFRDVHARRRQA